MIKRIISLVSFILVSLHGGFAQSQSAEETALEKIFPTSFDEYKPDGPVLTATSRVEDKLYVMSSRTFQRGKLVISITLFDYKLSPELLKRYTGSWNIEPIDDDDTIVSTTTVDSLPPFQHYDKKSKAAELYINAKDRYLVYITGNGHSTDYLKSVAKLLHLRQLPQ